MPEVDGPVLEIRDVVCGYGQREILHGITITVGRSEIVAIIGHNGAGKSTLLKAVFGLIPLRRGSVTVEGRATGGSNPRELLRLGFAYVPQGNRVFTELSVRENLEIGAITLSEGIRVEQRIESVVEIFPMLGNRLKQRAGTLSGGEKQILALGMALVLSPRILLLDEPSLGLAPPMAVEALQRIKSLNESAGVAVLIVEQKVREVLAIAARTYVVRSGQVSYSGPSDELQADWETLRTAFF